MTRADADGHIGCGEDEKCNEDELYPPPTKVNGQTPPVAQKKNEPPKKKPPLILSGHKAGESFLTGIAIELVAGTVALATMGGGGEAPAEVEPVVEPAEPASSASSGLNLTKSLASEQQMSEITSGSGTRIAGPGAGAPLRVAGRLASEYGGSAGDWVKVTSSHYKSPIDGSSFETHAYVNLRTGQVVEPKTKIGD